MCLGNVSEINSHLFLCGNIGDKKMAKLVEVGVTLVIDATNMGVKRTCGIEVLAIPIDDHPAAKISEFFQLALDRIAKNRQSGGKTVVHCMAGISRSATLVIAYLMREEKLSLTEAFDLVRLKRPIVQPNMGFWQQLEEFEEELKTSRTVLATNESH